MTDHRRPMTEYGKTLSVPYSHRTSVIGQRYEREAMYLIRSRSRQEYPHSLSYQAKTFTRVPSITEVEAPSTMAECGSWMKSTETRGSSVYSMSPWSSPAAALLKAWFTSPSDVTRSTSATRSISDTFAVGTRMAIPWSFPCSSGKTNPTALAAPVVVGI